MAGGRATTNSRAPFPGVHFSGDFVGRLERLVFRLALAHERKEGMGSAALAGAGEEFVGYRPYRPGEDLRGLAWDLLARLDRPYVRVTRREAAERWSVLIDTSASMGVGPPGKLQAAAEIAAAITSIGLRAGASVELRGSDGAAPLLARRPTDLPGVLQFLQGLRARGQAGLGQLLSTTRPGADCGRVVLVGDLFDLSPGTAVELRRSRTELLCTHVLASVEAAPPPGASVEWLDPEGDGVAPRNLDGKSLSRYELVLQDYLAGWEAAAVRHGFTYKVHSSESPFEDTVRALLEA